MEEPDTYEPATSACVSECLAPLGLSETDWLNISGWVKSLAPGQYADYHEDAIGLPSLIIAPVNASRLKRSLVVFRINRRWFLGEIADGVYHERSFARMRDLLEATRDWLVLAASNAGGLAS